MTYAYLRVSTGKQDGDNQRLGVDDFAKRKAEGVQLGRKWGSKNSYTKLTKHLDFIQNELDKGTPKIQIARKINVNVRQFLGQ